MVSFSILLLQFLFTKAIFALVLKCPFTLISKAHFNFVLKSDVIWSIRFETQTLNVCLCDPKFIMCDPGFFVCNVL